MTDRPDKPRMQINVRLTPAQVAQLAELIVLYGSQSRAITAAIENLWSTTAEARARFVIRDDETTPDATPPSE